MALLSEDGLREHVARLAAIPRASASAGEREAARLIAEELRAAGAQARVEEERVHPTHWLPAGLPTAAATLAALAPGRRLPAAVAALAAWSVADDVSGGRRPLRDLLFQRTTANVVARVGPDDAQRTLVFVAHHDAAHSGLIFHPDLGRALWRRFPGLLERTDTSPPLLWGAVLGPALVALGALTGRRSLRAGGGLLSAGYAAAMTDIGLRSAVPGANDNLTAVAVLFSLARDLAVAPPEGLRVLLISTGSEECHQAGMRRFAERHFAALDPATTHVICLDTLGSPELVLLEGEGMLWMNEYPEEVKTLVADAAAEAGVHLRRGLRFRNATDGLVALQHGLPAAMIGSVDEFKMPTDYHWPTDTADRVNYTSVAGAARLCRALAGRLARAPGRYAPAPVSTPG